MKYVQDVVPYSESDFYEVFSKRERLLNHKRLGQKTLLEHVQELDIHEQSSTSYESDQSSTSTQQNVDEYTPEKQYLKKWRQKSYNSAAEQQFYEMIVQRQRNLKSQSQKSCQNQLMFSSNKKRKKNQVNSPSSDSIFQRTEEILKSMNQSSKRGVRPSKMFMERWNQRLCCSRCTSPVRASSGSPVAESIPVNYNRYHQDQYSPQQLKMPVPAYHYGLSPNQFSPPQQGTHIQGAKVQEALRESIGEIRKSSQPLKPHQYATTVEGGLVRSNIQRYVEKPLDYLICSVCNKPCCQGCNCDNREDNRRKVISEGQFGFDNSSLQKALDNLRGTSKTLQTTLIDLNVDLKSQQYYYGQQ
eukprot:TRINITY_DN2562_c0_g1_i6.p2 TRINITY_DN2562_c0_g1~~TRINITY_DN2562_c0_g1_i6.p2  ORF type:complete len:358 (-),score=15.52 TRINITY_DN2562_c0_g1_i6:498-1571(-)